MFQLTAEDREVMERKKIVPRIQITDKDPFMHKPKPIWRGFHRPIASTEELMESLEPYETRKSTNPAVMDRFRDQERRYYVNHEEIEKKQQLKLN